MADNRRNDDDVFEALERMAPMSPDEKRGSARPPAQAARPQAEQSDDTYRIAPPSPRPVGPPPPPLVKPVAVRKQPAAVESGPVEIASYRCLNCGYPLQAESEFRCSECGR